MQLHFKNIYYLRKKKKQLVGVKSGEGQHGVIQIRAQDKSPKVKFQKQARHTGDAGNEHAEKHAQKQPADEEKGEQAGADGRKGRLMRTRWNQPGQTRHGEPGAVKHEENELAAHLHLLFVIDC